MDAFTYATLISNGKDLKSICDKCKKYGLTRDEIESVVSVYNLHTNINSLHKSQKVLVSSIKELYRVLRRYDKNFRRQIKIDIGKETRTEET